MLGSLRNKRIMVVAAHPDDELLGLGATIHHLIRNYQCRAFALVLGEGITSRAGSRNREEWKDELQRHRENMENAASIIGYESITGHDLPDNRFDAVPLLDIIKIIEDAKDDVDPEIIFTHHGGDLNIDHQITFQAVMTAVRPMEHEKVKAIVAFETPSGTEWQAVSDPRKFAPNLFMEITDEDLDAKIKGMDCYEFERRPYPHPRSAEALKVVAQRWGITIGRQYAEAFQIIRMIL